MADLSRQSQRRTTQDRITNNRDAILPTRREDRVDPVRINASMRDAQRAVLANPQTAHPYYWAPFNLIGNWRLQVAP